MKFNHAEAFHVMPYQCEGCEKLEYIWNSRDGVTPFLVPCSNPECNDLMAHVMPYRRGGWEATAYKIPDEVDRVFTSMTLYEAAIVADKRIDALIELGHLKEGDPLIPDIRERTKQAIFNDGLNPSLISRDKWLRINALH